MAVVLEAMPFSAAWRKRQNRVQTIQRLYGALLVHAEDSGMSEVQADACPPLSLQTPDHRWSYNYATDALGAQIDATLD